MNIIKITKKEIESLFDHISAYGFDRYELLFFSCFIDGVFSYEVECEPVTIEYTRFLLELNIIADDDFIGEEHIETLLNKKRVSFLNIKVYRIMEDDENQEYSAIVYELCFNPIANQHYN